MMLPLDFSNLFISHQLSSLHQSAIPLARPKLPAQNCLPKISAIFLFACNPSQPKFLSWFSNFC
jgi:hypothetical protein